MLKAYTLPFLLSTLAIISPVARLALLPDEEVTLEPLELDPLLVVVEETAAEEDVPVEVEDAALDTLEEDFKELLEDELVVLVSVFLLKLWFKRKTPPKINRTAIIATITLALLDFCCILKTLI